MGTWAHNMLSKCVMGPQHRRHAMFRGQHRIYLMYWIYLMSSIHLVALANRPRCRSAFLVKATLLVRSAPAWLAVAVLTQNKIFVFSLCPLSLRTMKNRVPTLRPGGSVEGFCFDAPVGEPLPKPGQAEPRCPSLERSHRQPWRAMARNGGQWF